jgi:hypothetical protein
MLCHFSSFLIWVENDPESENRLSETIVLNQRKQPAGPSASSMTPGAAAASSFNCWSLK